MDVINTWKNSAILKRIIRIENAYFRHRCKNQDFTILTPNCMAGLIYHRLGMRFCSPTIDTSMETDDFIRFVSDLDYYLSQDITEFKDHDLECPVGMIAGKTPDENVRVNFVHYSSFQAGRDKWNQRKLRVTKDNLYIIVCDVDDIYQKDYRRVGYLSDNQLAQLETVPCQNMAVLTRKKDRKQQYAHYIRPNYRRPYPLFYMNRDVFGLNGFEKHFDFIGFLNQHDEPEKKSTDCK